MASRPKVPLWVPGVARPTDPSMVVQLHQKARNVYVEPGPTLKRSRVLEE